MKMKQYIKGATLALAAVATVGMAAPNAHAVWSGGGSVVPVIDQGLNSLGAKTAAKQAGSDAVYTSVPGESLAANDTITINLTGGLTFSATPPTLLPSAGDVGAGATTASVPLSGGTQGSTTATWRVVSAVTSTSTLTLNSYADSIFDVTGVTAGSNADIQLSLKTASGLVIGAASRSFKKDVTHFVFTGVNLTTVTAINHPTDTAQVVTLFKFFNTAGTNKTGKGMTATVTNNATSTSLPTGVIAANKLLYTLAGNFNGIASVKVLAAKVTGDDGTGAAAGTVNTFTINTAKTKAFAVNTSSIAANGTSKIVINSSSGAPGISLVLDGTTSQEARSFTLAIDVLADAMWSAHAVQAATTEYTIARNGFAFTTTQTGMGSTNVINIRDRSNALPTAGANIIVVVTTYDAATGAGTKTPTITLTKKLKNLGQVKVTSADIIADAATAGTTIPTGVPANIFFTVNTSNGTASVKKQVPGVGLDIGSVSSTTGNMLK